MSAPMIVGDSFRFEWMQGDWDCSLQIDMNGVPYFHALNLKTDQDTESIRDVYGDPIQAGEGNKT